MTVVSSYEAQFSAVGVQETKNGFAEIAKAAALSDRQQKVNAQNLRDYAKQQIQTEKEKVRAAQMAAKEQAKAAASTDAMYKKVAAGAAVAAAAVVKFGVDSYKAFQQYAGSVRDVALASGATAEQASLFLQVLDDFEVSADDVSASMRAMTKNGLTPTLDTLARLADQYVAINDPMEKNKFLLDNLGKSGLAWANALSQGGDALRANAEEVNKNLILTDEQIKKAEMARLAVDAWADAWEGFKVSIGGAIGGIIAGNAEAEASQERLSKATGLTWDQIRRASMSSKEFASNIKALSGQLRVGAAATEYWKNIYKDVPEIISDASAEMQKMREQEIKNVIDIQKSNDDYQASQQEILDTIDELKAKKEDLHPWERDEIAKINEQIEEQKEKYAEGAEAFGKAQSEKLVMLALEQIALSDGVAGYSEAEAAKAEILLNTAGIAEESAFRQALAFDKAAAAIAKGSMEADELKKLLEAMEEGYSIDVAVNVVGSREVAAGVGTQTAAQQSVGWQGGMWQGGNLGVPGFAGGGTSGGWGVVGDRQGGGFIPGVSELIFGNARVFNSRQSEKMLKSGMFGGVPGFAEGGDTSDNWQFVAPPPPKRTTTRDAKSGSSSAKGSFGGGSDYTAAVQAIEMQSIEMQSTTQSVVTQVAMQFQQMTQQFIESNQNNANILQNIANILQTSNPQAVGAAVGYEVSKRS